VQFITNGPDVPEALLQAQEEGRVVFFCGAGISYPADLPDFQGLVDRIYSRAGTKPNAIEQEAYNRKQFDATLDLLERRLPGQRLAVRKALAEVLKPKLRRKGATETHAALLQLARNQGGALRLVTTNFDRIFEVIAKRTKQLIQSYAAPMLPIPKNSRWDGLVYLHGLLPKLPDDGALNRLVVTSGDFGLAYLTERWAARFVSELFRNYVVCFVGYSIDDPVLRYMMDALAADRRQGEITPQAYAFGGCPPGQEKSKAIEWEAKGVAPILYDSANKHAVLHDTLKAWAETWRDGILGKERIVVDYAITRPSASTKQDDFVGRMLWALSHESGLPAKRFADFNPAPALDWLDAFSEDRYLHSDLSRFAVPPRSEVDAKLRFSLIRRPTPYLLAQGMALVTSGADEGGWDAVMFYLAQWLTRHLNDPKLIHWLAQWGGQLHPRWVLLIEQKLDLFSRLEREAKTTELDDIRANAPNGIPGPLMRPLWRLLLTGRVKSLRGEVRLYRWKDRLKREGLSATLRLELRELLAPKITLKKPFRFSEDDTSTEAPERLKQLVDWELVLAADHVHSAIRDLSDGHWQAALPEMLDDIQQLLRDALDLLHELGEADDRNDRSHWDMPSISQHRQNRGFRDWVVLIELLRDSWLAIRGHDLERATRIAQAWFDLPYSTFKRLALFAASQDGCISPDQWVEWLLADDAWWLWTSDTKRETMRLLVLQGRHLPPRARARLEEAILAGPPRKMYPENLEVMGWQDLVERSAWLHLAKLQSSSRSLGTVAKDRLTAISVHHPDWRLASNESDEFSTWMSGTGDPDYKDHRQIDIAPHKRQELIQWLQKPPVERQPFYEDTWPETCKKHAANAGYALSELASQGIWPAARWRDAFYAWSEKDLRCRKTWQCFAPYVQNIPDDVLQQIIQAITWWMETAAKSIDRYETILMDLCHRVLELPLNPGTGILRNGKPIDEPVSEAINHPIGHVAQTLLNLWFKGEPNDNDRLPANIEPLFTQLCDNRVERYQHGRVLLASNLIALFRVDRPWAEAHLLPMFDWASDPVEARAAWEGFLWSPRLYPPLLTAFKSQFLETARHYDELGEHQRQFAAFMIFAALEPVDNYSPQDFQAAIGAFPQEGLEEAARALSQALEGAGEKREDYWKNRVQPFWHHVWPKSRDLASEEIAESLVRLCIAAGAAFPSALSIVQDWLQPIELLDYDIGRLDESGLCGQFPTEALCLLNAIIDDQPWAPEELGKCLGAISQADPTLLRDARYRRLEVFFRQRKM
jgi:hypothetical protein